MNKTTRNNPMNGNDNASALARCIAEASNKRTMLADDDGIKKNKLKVLVDGDGMRLLMDIYNSYVSEEEYANFLEFAMEVDDLLYRHRGNRPLTREEKQLMEENGGSTKKKKKKPTIKKTKPKPEGVESAPTPEMSVEASTVRNFVAEAMMNRHNQ